LSRGGVAHVGIVRRVRVVAKPVIGVIMYQTSNSKGQELVAQRMVKVVPKAWLRILLNNEYLSRRQ